LSCKDVGGPHRLLINSRATSVMWLRLHRSAVVGRIHLRRENYHRVILDFCNSIGTKRRTAFWSATVAFGPDSDIGGSRLLRRKLATRPISLIVNSCFDGLS